MNRIEMYIQISVRQIVLVLFSPMHLAHTALLGWTYPHKSDKIPKPTLPKQLTCQKFP